MTKHDKFKNWRWWVCLPLVSVGALILLAAYGFGKILSSIGRAGDAIMYWADGKPAPEWMNGFFDWVDRG